MPRARTLARTAVLALAVAALAGCGGPAPPAAAPTAAGTVLGWFAAVNAHDTARAERDVAPAARPATARVERAHLAGTIFTDVKCVDEPGTARDYAAIYCTFHAPPSLSIGDPHPHAAVELHRVRGRWQIVEYDAG